MDLLNGIVEFVFTWCTPYKKGFALMAAFIGLAIFFGMTLHRWPAGDMRIAMDNLKIYSALGCAFLCIGQFVAWDYFTDGMHYRTVVVATTSVCFGLAIGTLIVIVGHSLAWKRHIVTMIVGSMLLVTVSMLLDYVAMAQLMNMSATLLKGIEVVALIGAIICTTTCSIQLLQKWRSTPRKQQAVDPA